MRDRGVESIRVHELELTCALVEGLQAIPGVTVHGPLDAAQRTATVSITVAGHRVSEIGLRLDDEFDILCRVGLHGAPAAHRTLGTLPEGTVRLPGQRVPRPDAIQFACEFYTKQDDC